MDPSASSMNTRILKEPLGFIRIIQLPMAILAFATTAGYSQTITIPVPCSPERQASQEFGYPFDLINIKVPGNYCNEILSPRTVVLFSFGAMSQSQFFVCTGVLAFLYVLAILSVYLLSWNNYKTDPRYPMADFLITGALALFWFIGSCAWASGVSVVKFTTDPELIGKRLRDAKGSYPCNEPTAKDTACSPAYTWNYASLNISLILGFACTALWAVNLWFIYKETVWYKGRMAASNIGAMGTNVQVPPFGGAAGQGMMGAGGGTNARPPSGEFQY